MGEQPIPAIYLRYQRPIKRACGQKYQHHRQPGIGVVLWDERDITAGRGMDSWRHREFIFLITFNHLVFTTSIQFEYPSVRQVVRKTQSDFGWDWVRLTCCCPRIVA